MSTPPPAFDLLTAALKPVLNRQAGVALALWGEAGIGKTHALTGVLSSLPCRQLILHATVPRATLVQQLPRPKKLPLWTQKTLEHLARREPVDAATSASALATALAGLAPFVLAFEDGHEADAERLELIERLARLVRETRGVGLVLTSRVEPPPPFRALRIEPLDRAGSDALLYDQVRAPLPAEALGWIYDRAAGNPLFSLEYFRHLARQGHLWNDGQRWHWRRPPSDTMPTSVEALLEQHLGRAAEVPVFRYVLEAKAMLPRDAGEDLWASVARVSRADLVAAVAALMRHGVLREGEFAHPLLQEVLVHTITPSRRRDLSRRAINVLTGEPERAARFVAEAELPDREALAILEGAAARVRDRNEVQAARFLAQAVHHAEGEQRVRLAVRAATGLQWVDHHQARELVQGALAADPGDRAATLLLAELWAIEGRSEEVEELLGRLPDDGLLGAEWTRRHIGLRFALGDYPAVLATWAADPTLQRDPEPLLAYHVGFSHIVQGSSEAAEAIALPALAAPDLSDLTRARLLTVCGLARNNLGDAEAAAPLLDEAVTRARASGQTAYLASTLHNRSMLHEETNRVAAMLADTREALELYAETKSTRHYASTLTKLARLTHELGNHAEAEAYFLESRQLHLQGDVSHFLVTCEVQLGQLYLDWRSPHAAVLAPRHAQAAVEAAGHLDNLPKRLQALYGLSLIETWLGRPQRGLDLAEDYLRLQVGVAGMVYQGLHARGFALEGLGQVEDAEALYQQAFEVALEDDWHVYAHKIGLELDRLRDDRSGARRRVAWFEKQGLMNGVMIAMRYFPELTSQTAPATTSTVLPRLEILGAMRVVMNGVPQPVQGRKRQEFLLHLLEARISGLDGVAQLELIDALYADRSEDAALTALKQLVHQIRQRFGDAVVLRTADGYALGELHSDAERFLDTGDVGLWRGPYPAGSSFAARLGDVLYAALTDSAEALLTSDPEAALRALRLVLAADPYNKRVLALHLQASRTGDDSALSRRLYDEARVRFADLGEVLPTTWQAFLQQV